jgi:hypothetical protein
MNMGHVAVGYLVMDQCAVTVELWHRTSGLVSDIPPKSFTTNYRLAMKKQYLYHQIWQDYRSHCRDGSEDAFAQLSLSNQQAEHIQMAYLFIPRDSHGRFVGRCHLLNQHPPP